MEDNPSLKIELSSHTDSRGSDNYNWDLSDRRAKSAIAYIISKGISPERLVAAGYGETRLVNRCSDGVSCSAAEHQANRRTEIKILEL
jgi:outer membrane protein OmpA-like peptidoglycan-associated protein